MQIDFSFPWDSNQLARRESVPEIPKHCARHNCGGFRRRYTRFQVIFTIARKRYVIASFPESDVLIAARVADLACLFLWDYTPAKANWVPSEQNFNFGLLSVQSDMRSEDGALVVLREYLKNFCEKKGLNKNSAPIAANPSLSLTLMQECALADIPAILAGVKRMEERLEVCEKFIGQLQDWFKKNMEKDLLLDDLVGSR